MDQIDVSTKERIISLSVELERQAERFYRDLAKKYPEQCAIFTSLADDEKCHAKTYSRLLESELPSDINSAEISSKYLETLSEKGVIDELLRSRDFTNYSLEDIVDYAIKMEKQTELFYSYSLGLFNNLDQRIIQGILLSEHIHRKKLIDLKENLIREAVK